MRYPTGRECAISAPVRSSPREGWSLVESDERVRDAVTHAMKRPITGGGGNPTGDIVH
ncbi:MAG: hypothetical protein ACJ8J0_19820 [Longimicrobiaceae bacterium]